MMKLKRFAAVLTAVCCAASVTACDISLSDFADSSTSGGLFGDVFSQDEEGTPEESDSEQNTTVQVYAEEPAGIYASLDYQPEMFFGKYIAPGTEGLEMNAEAKEAFCLEMSYFNSTCCDKLITRLPYRIEAGPHSNVTSLHYIKGYNWMQLYFYTEKGKSQKLQAAYTVSGNKLTIRLLKNYSFNAQTNHLSYEFSNVAFSYTFSFSGAALTLVSGDETCTLYPEDLYIPDSENPDQCISQDAVYLYDARLRKDSEAYNGIEAFHFLGEEEKYITIDSVQHDNPDYTFAQDGTFTLNYRDADNTLVNGQAAYFYCDDDGLILTDGEHTCYYTESSWELYTKDVETSLRLDESGDMETLTDEELQQLIEKTDALYQDLSEAFQNAGIKASVNNVSGEISLDSLVLFALNSSEISREGQRLLDAFMKAYCDVIFSEKYNGFVSQILVEGHTDPNGPYELNLQLSKDRASAVKDYCLSGTSRLESGYTDTLKSMMTAIGCASDEPVYYDNGAVNAAASRRVSFRFLVKAVPEQE